MTPTAVTIVEVGPRDGLQNEAAAISTADKVQFVDALSAAGHQVIEVSSFVSPRWVPQMADAAEVFAGITRRPGVRYTALVPNLPGLERAIAARVSEVAVFAAASETFSTRNINQSIDESLHRYTEVIGRALAAGLRVRGYVSCAFGCPFEGPVTPAAVLRVTRALLDAGAYEVAVSDTIGVGHPGQVRTLLTFLGVPARDLRDELFGGGDAGGRGRERFSDDVGHGGIELSGGHDGMHEPDRERLRGAEPCAGQEQRARVRHADLRQHEGRDHRRQDAELRFGEAEDGAFLGDDDVAHGSQPRAAAECRPVDAADTLSLIHI